MTSLRAFISGLFFPSLALPFILSICSFLGFEDILKTLFVHVIPLFWGIWNVMYFAYCEEKLPGSENVRLLLTGAGLGFLVALIGVFWIDIPGILKLEGNFRYLPLVAVPILYAIFWRFIVKPLNAIVGIQ